MKVALIFPLLFAAVSGAGISKDALQEEDWSFQTHLDESIEFHCNDSLIKLNTSAVVQWVLPDRTILSSSHKGNKYAVGDEMNITGNTLMIYDVTEGDKGLYLCCVQNEEPWCKQHTLRGLNIAGHKVKNLFDKYEHNLIVAVITALVFFVPLIAICLIYKYRYMSDEDKMKKRTMRKVKYDYDDEVKARPTSADMVASNEGNGSYYNPGVETKL